MWYSPSSFPPRCLLWHGKLLVVSGSDFSQICLPGCFYLFFILASLQGAEETVFTALYRWTKGREIPSDSKGASAHQYAKPTILSFPHCGIWGGKAAWTKGADFKHAWVPASLRWQKFSFAKLPVTRTISLSNSQPAAGPPILYQKSLTKTMRSHRRTVVLLAV